MIDLGDNRRVFESRRRVRVSLDHAVREARRIRRNLVRLRRDTDLGGDCGLASLFLAEALGGPASLRGTRDMCADPCLTHVWNVIDGFIIDITATQFNDSFACDDAGEPPVFGVLVTKKPRLYHRPVQFRGRQVLDYLVDEGWYEGDQDHRRLRSVLKRLRRATGGRNTQGVE